MLPNCQGITYYDGNPNVNSVIKYQKGDILISNIRPYLQKIWLANHDGGCSPDVLVLRINNQSLFLQDYVYYALKRQEFFNHMMSVVSGTKMPRGNKENTLEFVIPNLAIEEQQRVISLIRNYESSIEKIRHSMDACAARKQAILDKYLK